MTFKTHQATVLTFANFKGGVGKTTTSTIFAYQLATAGKKVLLVDFDPQANATNLICRTYNIEKLDATIYDAMKVGEMGDLNHCLVKLTDNLDLIPSDLSLTGFSRFLEEILPKQYNDRAFYMDYLLTEYKEIYDFIIIDTPPTISDYTNNAIVSSDYVLVVMQTQSRSLDAALQMVPYVEDIQSNYGVNASILGIIPVLHSKKGSVDDWTLKQANDNFGSLMFDNVIETRERIKRFDVTGITDLDFHDYKVLNMYWKLCEEMQVRIEQGVVANG